MKKYLFPCFVSLLCIFCSDFLDAQSFYGRSRDRHYILFAGGGLSSYFGDLNNSGDIIDPSGSFYFGLQRNFGTRLAARVDLGWYRLTGDDKEYNGERQRTVRNLSFTSGNYEATISGVVNLLPYKRRFYQRSPVNIYGFAGIGLTYFNPKAELDGVTYALQPLQTEGVSYSRLAFVIPMGGGVKFKVSPFLNLGLEVNYRKTFTDYIDDVSNVYIDNTTFDSDIARNLADRDTRGTREAGEIRGNPNENDGYATYTLRAEYFLPYQIFQKNRRKRRGRARRPKSRVP